MALRPELENERTLTHLGTDRHMHAAYCGTTTGDIVRRYLAMEWCVYTTTELRKSIPKQEQEEEGSPVANEGGVAIKANRPLSVVNVKRCVNDWKIRRFPVVVFPSSTPEDCAQVFREQAGAKSEPEKPIEQMPPKAAAESMRDSADELVAVHNLYIALERRIEGTADTLEDAIRVEQLDPEVARKLLRYRENVGYVRRVLEAIIKAGLNGDFSIVEAYRSIEPPTQLQARIAIDIMIVVSEIMFQFNQVRARGGLRRDYPSISSFTFNDVVDMCLTALLMNTACWGEDGTVKKHEAKSADNYAAMRRHMPSLPETELLIQYHSALWPHNWVYCTRVATRRAGERVDEEFSQIGFQLETGPDEAEAIEKKARALFDLAALESLGIDCDTQVWKAEPDIILRIAILAIAEQLVCRPQQDGAPLQQVFGELAALLETPMESAYTLQGKLHHGLSLFSHALAAAATEYRTFPRGAIVLFDCDSGEACRDEAQQVAVDGGIALSLGGSPEELLLISHEDASGPLEEPRSVRELLRPTLDARKLPKFHFIPLNRTNDRIYRRRGTVLGITDKASFKQFIAPWADRLAQARKLAAVRK